MNYVGWTTNKNPPLVAVLETTPTMFGLFLRLVMQEACRRHRRVDCAGRVPTKFPRDDSHSACSVVSQTYDEVAQLSRWHLSYFLVAQLLPDMPVEASNVRKFQHTSFTCALGVRCSLFRAMEVQFHDYCCSSRGAWTA